MTLTLVALLLAIVSAIITIILFARGGFGSSEAIRSLRDARDVLNDTVEGQRGKLDDANKEIAELRGKTDVTIALVSALNPINEWTVKHEQRAQERHEATIKILGMIARHLGPENNGSNDDI